MKKYLLYMLLPLLAALGSCQSEEEIVFDHELPQFELKSDAILLEVIMPQGTTSDDHIYITGPFNGEDEAIGKVEWQLEQATGNDVKWGIYLKPSMFQDGKTLADGFSFVSEKQGREKSVFNEDVCHTLNVGLGSRTNVTVSRWAAYFETDEPDEEEHDGYVIYVEDNSGWDGLALYAWGDGLPELFGGWPGAQPMGTEVKNGITFKYFDTGEANEGLTYNLIFNNNGGGEQFDATAVTLNRDYYLRITNSSWEEIDASELIPHDGYAIFIADNSGWNDLALYAWGDGLPELFGVWPGIQATGTVTIKGVTYQYFDTGAANEGMVYNLICNDNNGGLQFDLAQVTLNRHYYFNITDTGGVEVDPYNPETTDENL